MQCDRVSCHGMSVWVQCEDECQYIHGHMMHLVDTASIHSLSFDDFCGEWEYGHDRLIISSFQRMHSMHIFSIFRLSQWHFAWIILALIEDRNVATNHPTRCILH